ncbi:hypothetical protein LOD99_1564 [Oopsacas minuta]|uniref:MULE transposase domain-containing protein n=1 Tax=Oopsacas minuta TaxID=111878 RepID=A0AAV7K7N0_9METZ|nr:hypothetical protein LOD99_1564 [Oopsacas minuta]
MEIVKRMNEHLHVPDVQATACCGIKVGIKRETRDTHDSSQCIIGEGMLTASEGTAAKLPPVQPTALAELFLPAEYQRTAKEEQFLLYNSGEDDAHRFLIFGTQRTLGMLQQSKICLFVLLPNKTEDTYRRMWEQIRILCPLAQPERMLLDFEKGAINSFEHVCSQTAHGARYSM